MNARSSHPDNAPVSLIGRGSARRGQLIAAAIQLGGTLGVAEAPVKQIARHAGVAAGLVHYYFESKDALLVAVVDELEADLRARWRAAMTTAEDPLERLVAGLRAIVDHAEQAPERRRLLIDLSVAGLRSNAVGTAMCRLDDNFISAIDAELAAALTSLPGPGRMVTRPIAAAVAGAVNGAALQALLHRQPPELALQGVVTLLMALIATAYGAAGLTPPLARISELTASRRRSAP